MPRDLAFSDHEISTLFSGLETCGLIGMAVSGGPDSLALLHLFARWLATLAAPPPTRVITVDHRLRPQSADEASFVAVEAAALGLPHTTLTWDGTKPSSGLPAAAREARYALMAQYLQAEANARPGEPPIALLTAHTADDQAETVLMRLARGSGLEGLAGMRPVRPLPGAPAIALRRPLLAVPKARLEATLTALGRTWITDPTNADPAYERPRLRQLYALRMAAGLTAEPLALAAARLARADAAITTAVAALEATAVEYEPSRYARISLHTFDAAPEEVRIRLLATLMQRLGGESPPARLVQIELLAAQLSTAPKTATLGGCTVTPGATTILITREPGRGLPQMEITPGQTIVWDARFQLTLTPEASSGCLVRALTPAQWHGLSNILHDAGNASANLPSTVALTLPTVWIADELAAVPWLAATPDEWAALATNSNLNDPSAGDPTKPGSAIFAPSGVRRQLAHTLRIKTASNGAQRLCRT